MFFRGVRAATKARHYTRSRLCQIIIAQMVGLWATSWPAKSVELHKDQFWVDLGQTLFGQAKGLALFVCAVHCNHVSFGRQLPQGILPQRIAQV